MSRAKKYEFTGETRQHLGRTLRQIRAVVSFGAIAAGTVGGWIEDGKNLSHDGDAWVHGNARVYGDAQVYGDAWVHGDAWVSGNARVSGNAWVSGNARVSGNADIEKSWHYIVVGPIGSENVCATIARTKGGGHQLTVGCWADRSLGTLMKEVKRRRKVEYKWTSASEGQQAQWMAEYRALKALGKVVVARWAEPDE